MRRRSVTVAAATAAGALGAALVLPAAHAAPEAATPSYTITSGAVHSYGFPDDTPASSFIDSDGTFYTQQSDAEYGANGPRQWSFFTGTNFDDATPDNALNTAVNPSNPLDRNDDTTWRCNNSPTGLESTYDPNQSHYTQRNFCDLVGVWVDPDTGDWYGVVHNEFTPQPFGDGLHYDSLDYAVSTDHGHTWTIKDHIVTSPYSTKRGDTTAFPNQTFDYGDGDPRLLVDVRSGYFYLYYGSRVLNKPGGTGPSRVGYAHVARAPMSAKMAPGSWHKFYDGSWNQPGVGGKESDLVPVSQEANGYLPPAKEYNPENTGSTGEQIAAGTMQPKSPLFLTNVAWDAYLNEYIGEPEQPAVNGSQTRGPLPIYATDDLGTQKWHLVGTVNNYDEKAWYRWMVDSGAASWQGTVGKTFRSYCSISCSTSDGEWLDVTIGSSAPAPAPVQPGVRYRISSGSGRALAQSGNGSELMTVGDPAHTARAAWKFSDNGDGSFTVVNASTGDALGVGMSPADRAWGTSPIATAVPSGGPTVGQQWFIERNVTTPEASGATRPADTFRLVNRYSGLVLSLSSGAQPGSVTTTPYRNWTGAGQQPADQTVGLARW
ncbi:RICIN domain-containing protein [Flexivirga alba]|uniref:RICIN domain-containing protein n=1 Tax=Flexivirga alba TaxID=702742 RepID=A0ABW2ABP4_9MICO